MKSLKSFATMSALVLTSATLPLSAMAGGSAAGSASGAYVSGSSSAPSQSMRNRINDIVGGGSTPTAGFTIQSPAPQSILLSTMGIPPNTNVIFQGPSTTISAVIQEGGSLSFDMGNIPDSLKR